jgi:multimeric flavodoxin WrbA
MRRHLLIVYHSQSGHTDAMARAAYAGATDAAIELVDVRMLRAAAAGPDDLIWAHGLLLGTPENFGYMSGMMKDFLERVFYPCEGKVEGRPYALFVGAGQDGTGAVTSVERIVTGLRLRRAHEAIIALKELTPELLARCEELGATFAAGLALGVL